MKAIPRLMPGAVESDILQRRASQIGVDPKGEDPLVGPAKLARTGEDAAPVDPDGEFECFAVFQRQAFRSQFRASVKGEGRRRGEILGDAMRANPFGQPAALIGFKPIVLYDDRDIRQRPDGIDTARAQKNESRAVPLGQLQEVNGSVEIMLNQLAAAGHSIDAGEHARVGGGVDDPIDRRDSFQVARATGDRRG